MARPRYSRVEERDRLMGMVVPIPLLSGPQRVSLERHERVTERRTYPTRDARLVDYYGCRSRPLRAPWAGWSPGPYAGNRCREQ